MGIVKGESHVTFVKGWAELLLLFFPSFNVFYFRVFSVKPKIEYSILTITAEQTHHCVFTFPPPKPVLAPPLHSQSSLLFRKIKNINPRSLPNIYIQPMAVFILTVVQLVRVTYPRQDVCDGTSGNQPGSPCCV